VEMTTTRVLCWFR